MYIEDKSNGLSGSARIGRVQFSQTGRTLYYAGRQFKPITGYKYNHYDVETGANYWISGCKKHGGDRLYSGLIHIDDDVLEEYWTTIRNKPELKDQKVIRCTGKYAR